MPDKRIHELVETSDKSGKFIAVDDAALPEALKFDTDQLLDKTQTDALYVKLTGNETVNGIKTWNNNGVFEAGILVNLGGIDVTGNSNIAGTLGVDGALTVTIGGLLVTAGGLTVTAGGLTVSADGAVITGNSQINGTLLQWGGTYGITLSSESILFSHNSANYIRATIAGGYVAFITNARAASVANSNLTLFSTKNSVFYGNLGITDGTALTAPSNLLQLYSTLAVPEIMLKYVVGSNDADTGRIIFESDVAGKNSYMVGHRGASVDEYGFKFWTYNSGFIESVQISPAGFVGIGLATFDPIAGITMGSSSGYTGHGIITDRTGYAGIKMYDGTAGNLAIFNMRNTAAFGKIFMQTGATPTSRLTIDNDGKVGIGREGPQTLFEVYSSTVGALASFKSTLAANCTVSIDSASSQDAQLQFLENGSAGWAIGYDGGANNFKMHNALGTFPSIPRLTMASTTFTFTGSSACTVHFDAVSTSCLLYLRAGGSSDSIIYFQLSTSTKFLMGHDTSTSMFQIHSSTSFSSTAADFMISTTGHIGLGITPDTDDKLYVKDNNTSGNHFGIKIFMDGNNASAAQGISIQCGLDTLTGSDNTYMFAMDGNGSTVGTIIADTTSFRIFNAVSSRAYKDNIRDFEPGICAKFQDKRAQPKVYNFIGRSERERAEIAARGGDDTDLYGFVIEDLAEIFPSAVKQIPDGHGGKIPAYSDTSLIPFLAAAVKELTERLELLET